jgi:hypothetical protein
MTALRLVVATLAVWRLTHFLAEEDGPWDIVVRARRMIGPGFLGQMMDCFYCLSVWIALPFTFWVGHGWSEKAILWPALSGGAILLERVTKRESRKAPD